jgi:carbon monoxide dehydrogenase subunit G
MDWIVKVFTVLSLCIMAVSHHILAASSSMDPEERKDLENGKILMEVRQHPITKIPIPTGQSLVEGSVEEVWWVIIDFNAFGEFMPNVIYYRPLGWEGDRLLVDCKVRVLFLTLEYRLAYIIDEASHTTYWFYVKGPIRDAQGYFRIEPYDETRVLVTYTTTLDVGRAIPAVIEKALSKSTFPMIFKSLRQRVTDLKKKKPIKPPILPPKPAQTERDTA